MITEPTGHPESQRNGEDCYGHKKRRKQEMKDLDISISEKGKEDLKAIIGQENISFVYRREMTENEAYYKVQIKTDKGNYLLKNSLDWFDN